MTTTLLSSPTLISLLPFLQYFKQFFICCTSVIHLLFICCLSAFHLLFICCSSAVHLLYICCSSAVHLLFICCSSAVYLLFICCLSAVHLLFISYESLCYVSAAHISEEYLLHINLIYICSILG